MRLQSTFPLLLTGQLLMLASVAEALRRGEAQHEWMEKNPELPSLRSYSYLSTTRKDSRRRRRVAKEDEQVQIPDRDNVSPVDDEGKPKPPDGAEKDDRPQHRTESPAIEPALTPTPSLPLPTSLPTSDPTETPTIDPSRSAAASPGLYPEMPTPSPSTLFEETIIKKSKAPSSVPTYVITEPPTPDPTRKPPTPSPTAAEVVDDKLKLKLVFSVWTSSSSVEGQSSNVSGALEAGLVDALLEALCEPGSDPAANLSSVCVLAVSNATSRRMQEADDAAGTDGPAVLAESSTVQRRSRSGENGISWTEWTVAFVVVSVGDSYMQKAMDEGLTLSEALKAKSLEYLTVDVQAMLDQIIGSGELLTLLQQRWSGDALVSQVGEETATFENSTTEAAVYTRNDWPFIRIAGIALMSFTIVSYFVLYRLSAHRRRRLNKELGIPKTIVDTDACSFSVQSKAASLPGGSPLLQRPEPVQDAITLAKGSFESNDEGISYDIPTALRNLTESYCDCCT